MKKLKLKHLKKLYQTDPTRACTRCVTFKRLSASSAIIIHDQNSLRVTNVQMKKFGVMEDGTG
jgi:hypothetical protein